MKLSQYGRENKKDGICAANRIFYHPAPSLLCEADTIKFCLPDRKENKEYAHTHHH